jgi:hypothetical protein
MLVDPDGEARKPYPSKRSLSERLGLSERQVQRYIAEREQAGLSLESSAMPRIGEAKCLLEAMRRNGTS